MIRKPTYEKLEQKVRHLDQVLQKREQAEEMLRNEKKFTDIALNSQLDTFFLFEPVTGKAIRWNRAFNKITGYTDEEIAGMVAPDSYYSPEDLELADNFIQETLEKGIGTIQLELICKDGRKVPTEYKVSMIRNEEGKPKYLISIGRDITERKKAEEALRDSEEKFRSLFDLSPLPIAILELETGKFIDVNKKWCELTKYTPEQVLGKTTTELGFYSEDNRNRFIKLLEASGEVHGLEMEFKLKGGSTVSALMFAKLMRIAGKELIFNIFLDLTESKQAEKALRESEERLIEAQKMGKMGYWEFDLNTRKSTWSNQVYDLFEINPDQSTPDFMENMPQYYPEDFERIQRTVLKAMETGQTRKTDYLAKLPSGKTAYHCSTFHPIKDKNDCVTEVRGTVQDITERKLAEEEKIKLEIQLQQAQKMEAMGTLAGGIAHDFNNILSAIFGFTELAMGQAEKGSVPEKCLREVLTAGKRAKDLVQQILTFSRQTEKELKPVQITLITKEALKLLRASLPTTIEIKQNLQSDSLVMSDPTQIHQILMNLCTNAGHAMEEKGGVLEVKLEDVELDSAFSAVHPDIESGPYVQLTVSDTGCGMSQEVMNKIFDPFFTTKEKGVGTGMGLSVVHGIVKSYGGAINVYSEPGKGSTFKVILPVAEKRMEPEIEIEKPILGGTERILFVDDEQPITNLAKQLLEPFGYKVETRTSSMEAFELFKIKPQAFDVVITDMTMPNMTGEELSKKIMTIRPDIPVILCTGFSQRISEKRAKNSGISAFIMKPFLADEMTRTIRQVVDKEKDEKPTLGRRILVVDDEEQMRRVLKQMLESAGYQVSEAPDGKVALWISKVSPADLTITDLIMPEKEGIETIRELKRDFPEVRVIAISGGGKVGAELYLDMARELGIDRTLEKPFKKEDLLKAVKEVLG